MAIVATLSIIFLSLSRAYVVAQVSEWIENQVNTTMGQ